MPTLEGNASRIDEAVAMLTPLPTSAQQDRAAAITVCARATDLGDARDLLAMLGLHDGNLHDAQHRAGRFIHGTRSAVQQHQDAHTPLCDPCLRWQEVHDRNDARRAP
jgi:hypothetical protein